MKKLKKTAHAKINLYLHVLSKMPDGYHKLDSLVAFTEIGDVISINPAKIIKIAVSGPFRKEIKGENLIYTAIKKIIPHINIGNIGCHIKLEKNIPVSSGMGGGSSDAATALNLLIKLWKIKINKNKTNKLCMEIGSDVNICFWEKAAYFENKGEVIKKVKNFPSVPILLVNPLIEVNTKNIFSSSKIIFSKPVKRKPKSFSNKKELLQFLKNTRNDLEKVTISKVPEVGKILNLLKGIEGCELARMSGSGATCFAIFKDVKQLKKAEKVTSSAFPDYWIKRTKLKAISP